MPSRLTLLKLAEDLIRQSRAPFSAEEFIGRVQERWRRKISESTLNRLMRKLSGHDYLIKINAGAYLPYQAVLEKIRNLPLAVSLGGFETDRRIFIPGYRLLPFISNGLSEDKLVFLDPDGGEIPKLKKSFYLEDVIDFYRYSGDRYFPDQITVNEWMPAKSSVFLTVWDMKEWIRACGQKRNCGFKARLVDYDGGVFQIEAYSREERLADRLKKRALHVAMERVLARLCEEEDFCSISLEKQLLRVFYNLDDAFLTVSAFSLSDFLESLKTLTVVSCENGGPRLVRAENAEPGQLAWDPVPQTPTGQDGSLDEIFEDVGFPFNASEFKAILNASLNSEKYKTDAALDLLFGGKDDRFFSRKQRNAFYRHLRKMLVQVFHEEKDMGFKLVSELREKAVGVKLSLIQILRFLDAHEVCLADLPAEVLDQIVDLDHFCSEILPKFENRSQPPDLKGIRDIRLALKFILPNLARLEEDVYCRLGVD